MRAAQRQDRGLALRGVAREAPSWHRSAVPSVSHAPLRVHSGLRQARSSGARVPLAPFVAAALALAVESTTHLLDFGVYHLRIEALNSANEHSYSHWLATVAFAVGSVSGGLGARRAGSHRAAWWSICGLFGFLFVDTIFRLHDHIGSWPLLYAPILIGLAVALVTVARGTDLAVVVYAGLVLLFASLGIHVFGPSVVRALGWGPAGWAYQVKIALKEGSELAGWVLLVPALARLASRPASR